MSEFPSAPCPPPTAMPPGYAPVAQPEVVPPNLTIRPTMNGFIVQNETYIHQVEPASKSHVFETLDAMFEHLREVYTPVHVLTKESILQKESDLKVLVDEVPPMPYLPRATPDPRSIGKLNE